MSPKIEKLIYHIGGLLIEWLAGEILIQQPCLNRSDQDSVKKTVANIKADLDKCDSELPRLNAKEVLRDDSNYEELPQMFDIQNQLIPFIALPLYVLVSKNGTNYSKAMTKDLALAEARRLRKQTGFKIYVCRITDCA